VALVVERRLIAIEGVVQGVGFRPFVHRLAAVGGLRGFVRNDASGVVIDVEGDALRVAEFCRSLTTGAPRLSRIARVNVTPATPAAYDAFRIIRSDAARIGATASLTPPDVATCDHCLAELFDPANRRFGHAFISCTECGPRFTIVRDAPYDRERTTMASFAMCDDCRREYEEPFDRRFHAETIACPRCGPTLSAVLADATHINGKPIDVAVAALGAGQIVAIKALGGYHLACDATSALAVERMRERKHRIAKPFAVMVRDTNAARALAFMSAVEEQALESPERPVVVVPRRADADVASAVAPSQQCLGLMLPATPVHHLLLAALDRPLVMTSGNRSDEPVVIDDDQAMTVLGNVADLFLRHDRAIAVRCDDSVVQYVAGGQRTIRRSRGYAPRTIASPLFAAPSVLALGAELKNVVCLTGRGRAHLSPHIGDLGSASSRAALREAVASTMRTVAIVPEVIAHDLHPDYASTHLAHDLARELGVSRRVAVQHHHAHVASCIAEYGLDEPVIGIAFDGAGLGTDGAIWGGEFLVVDGARFSRRGHLAYVPLPGGDSAARRPWRCAAAHLAMLDPNVEREKPDGVPESEWTRVAQLLARPNGNMPRTSSVGRLFDAVASLLGVCHVSRFEGEAAMMLEAAADPRVTRGYDVNFSDGDHWTVDVGPLIESIVDDRARGRDIGAIAAAFHVALSDLVRRGSERLREDTGLATVVLTGGVFMNAFLLARTCEMLAAQDFRVLVPHDVPCNDGGLALGQAFVAARAIVEEEQPCV
jgi:hydrogenase maturation protein HypF